MTWTDRTVRSRVMLMDNAFQNLQILLIDDDQDSPLIIRGLLSQVTDTHYEVDWVNHFESGLDTLLQGRHGACLLDYHLGQRSGLDLLNRAVAAGCHVPILMMTGQGERDVDLQAMKAGAADFLSKGGLTATALERVLRYAVERHRAEKQRLRDEAHRQLFTQYLPAILWTTDEQLRITSSNGAGLRGLGLDTNELVGVTLFDYFQTDQPDHPAVTAHTRALAGESVSYEMEWMGKLFQTRVEPLRQGNDRALGTVGVALDITERRQVEVGFRAAQQIQQRLLPHVAPSIAGYDIAGICRPTDATGGDFFDYIPICDGTLGIVIADVSGHGFASALIMTETRRTLRTLASGSGDLGAIVTATNKVLIEDTTEDHFVTLFIAQLNPQTRTLNYVGAGHEGYLIEADGNSKRLPSTNLPLGVLETDFVSAGPVQLQPGEILVLLTDGFAESRSADGQLFGIERILDLVRNNRHKSAADILETLYRTVRDACLPAQPFDDITGIIVKIHAGSDEGCRDIAPVS